VEEERMRSQEEGTMVRYDDEDLLPARRGDSLADVLERVLDKGIVVAGDITINLLEIELLTIKLRLLIASVDKAREIGIDWWEHDEALSGGKRKERRELEERVQRLEEALEGTHGNGELESGKETEGASAGDRDEEEADPRDGRA
jgi:hypothetical protein